MTSLTIILYRLTPVISTLLKLTRDERGAIENVLKLEEEVEDDLAAITNGIGSFANNISFGSFGNLFFGDNK